ncbi:hypothetical protein [Azotobacter salinestris]|uniref:hypothetical protein n=1 Tax=Azotobacter salinestris TaxID=69964 RepID=UPI001266CF59|nr:hypothetical protein [Azotobacter salinestris]
MSISIATTKPSTTKVSGDAAATAFEREMRALGYRNFQQERGRYCLQILNDLKLAYLAGWRNGYVADKCAAA